MDPATITPSDTTHLEQEGHKVLLESGELVEDWLKQAIDWSKWPGHLADAVRYGLLGGGKRLRPVLVLQCSRAAGGRDDVALTAGGALELVHCFSLIHDDLPSLDNDELRRGQPTLHVHAGEPMAILAGDLMLAMAFGLLAQAPCEAGVRATLVDELATGTSDMVAGQVYDTLGGLPTTLPPVEQVKLVHRNKTGALIRAACRMGGHCAGADDDTIHALTTYGEAMGLMFQIVDDLLDVTQSADHVGKATGKDADSGKRTYPGVLGIEACKQEIERLRKEAVQALQPLNGAAEPLAALAEVMAIRTN